jgi:uncharacterized protein (TIGR02246 family)
MADARTPADVDRLFGERVNAGDVDGVVALYEPTATLLGLDGTRAIGHAAIRQAIAGLVALKPRMTMNVDTVVEAGDIAALYNDWHMTGIGPDGQPLEVRGHALEVVRRQADGRWLFVIDDPDARRAR